MLRETAPEFRRRTRRRGLEGRAAGSVTDRCASSRRLFAVLRLQPREKIGRLLRMRRRAEDRIGRNEIMKLHPFGSLPPVSALTLGRAPPVTCPVDAATDWPLPLPATEAGSMPLSAATRRTAGD